MEKALIEASLKALTACEAFSPCITSDDFAVLWAKLCAAYPRQETTTATAQVFFEQLSLYSVEKLTDAVASCISSSKWFPAVAEIIEQIKGDKACPHTFERAEIRMQRAELASRERMLEESEKYSTRRLDAIAKEVAELENRRAGYYAEQRKEIEASGLPQAQAKLDSINAQIVEHERVLAGLRTKIKLFDQARILQADA